MGLKVINLGLPKSGTTTLGKALRKAGFSVADHRLRDRESGAPGTPRIFVAKTLYQGLYEFGDPMALMQEYDALSEISMLHGHQSIWPQFDFGLLRTLQRLHPGVKFLATVRHPVEHSHSIMRWSNLGKVRLPAGHVPGLPPGFGDSERHQQRWIRDHIAALDHFFRDDENFMKLDVSRPWARRNLSRFLECDLPWWGKANENAKMPKDIFTGAGAG